MRSLDVMNKNTFVNVCRELFLTLVTLYRPNGRRPKVISFSFQTGMGLKTGNISTLQRRHLYLFILAPVLAPLVAAPLGLPLPLAPAPPPPPPTLTEPELTSTVTESRPWCRFFVVKHLLDLFSAYQTFVMSASLSFSF